MLKSKKTPKTKPHNIEASLDNLDNLPNLRTDMADEMGVDAHRSRVGNINKTKVDVDSSLSKKIGKPVGTYITVQASAVVDSNKADFREIIFALRDALLELGNLENCLVVGLGNAYLTADALGSKTVQSIIVTRHFKDELDGSLGIVSAITPSVLGITGIESFDIVKGVVERTKPSCIIAIDSLASATVSRLATAFQVSNAGITPGSGVGNSRPTLSKQNLGCQVYSIGVPLVVYATTILHEILQDANISDINKRVAPVQELILAPKDIDMLVANCATIVSQAINLALHPQLTIDELYKYV